MAGLMIAAELAQRRLVQLEQNFAELLGFRIAGCEILSVNLTQRADEGVSMFAADFAILVAVAVVESCLAHAALHCAAADSICPPGARGYQTRFKRGLVRLASQEL
jgi:hypothetical protein